MWKEIGQLLILPLHYKSNTYNIYKIIKLKGDLTTYKKLLNICLVSSDERELENVMKEQKTAAHAAHLS